MAATFYDSMQIHQAMRRNSLEECNANNKITSVLCKYKILQIIIKSIK